MTYPFRGIDTAALENWAFVELSTRKRVRQPERAQQRPLEASHGADPVAAEREDIEPSPLTVARGAAEVGTERGLTVGPRWDEVESSARFEDARAEASRQLSS